MTVQTLCKRLQQAIDETLTIVKEGAAPPAFIKRFPEVGDRDMLQSCTAKLNKILNNEDATAMELVGMQEVYAVLSSFLKAYTQRYRGRQERWREGYSDLNRLSAPFGPLIRQVSQVGTKVESEGPED